VQWGTNVITRRAPSNPHTRLSVSDTDAIPEGGEKQLLPALVAVCPAAASEERAPSREGAGFGADLRGAVTAR
jgi:hypothetical protein